MYKFHLGKFSLAVFLNFALFAHSAQGELSQITFDELEWVPLSSVATGNHAGWSVDTGNAVISPNGQGYQGGKSLLLPAGAEPETKVSRTITWNASDQTAFIDLLVKPAADPQGSLASFYANGTQLAFQVPADSETGTIWVYHGHGTNGSTITNAALWAETAGTFHVAPGTTEADAYIRVTLRHDYLRNYWDLFVDGKMVAANLSFEGREPNLTNVSFYGSLVGDTRVDNLSALATNMLFPDADKDGLPDAWETANGSNPNLYDRDALKPGTLTAFLDLYLASLWGNGGINARNGIAAPGGIPPLTILGSHQPVGSLKGALSVAGDGSASYSIPLDVPKGTAGMEPKLALGYSSNGSNGLVGLGWGVSGFQRITRIPCTVAKDGFYDPVDFDSNDRFALDGERLICVDGVYGAAGSKYRTEIDAFSQITAIGNGPDYWKVETKAGLTMYLGNTADSKCQVSVSSSYDLPVPTGTTTSLKITSWGVNRVEDSLENYYSVVYARDAVGSQPFEFVNDRVKEVHYTGNDLRGLSPYCHVLFDYGEPTTESPTDLQRPDISRAYTTYGGVKVTRLLRKVTVKTNNYVNHTYDLTYTNSYQSGRSLLLAVSKKMEGSDSKSVPATQFTYDGLQTGQNIWLDPGSTQLPTYSTNIDATQDVNSVVTTEDNNATIRLTGDVSRAYIIPLVNVVSGMKIQFDFKSDKLAKGAIIGLDSNTTYEATWDSVDENTQSKLYRIGGTGNIQMAPDVAGPRSGQVATPYFVGTTQSYIVGQGWKSFTLDATKFGTGSKGYLVLMCADDNIGDGTDEALFRNIKIYNSNTQLPADVSPIIFDLDTELPRFSAANGKDLGVAVLDLDGDGLPELTDWRATNYSTSSGLLTPTTNGNVYRNIGNGFVLDNSIRPPASLPLTVRAADDTAYTYAKKHHMLAQPMDVDGDGRMDLLGSIDIQKSSSVVTNRYAFYTKSSSGWVEKPGWALPFKIGSLTSTESNGERRDHHFQFTDLNQDGYPDLIVFTTVYGRLYDVSTGTQIAGADASVAYLNKAAAGPGWIRDDSYAPPERLTKTYNAPKDEGKRMLDLEGDSIADISQSLQAGGVFATATYKMSNPSGYKWNSTPGAENAPDSIYDLPVPMVDGDGVTSGATIMDVNGDNLPDIVRYLRDDPVRQYVYLNQGYRNYPSSSWVMEPTTTGVNSYHPPLPLHKKDGAAVYAYGYETADINGDGLTDILYSNDASTWTVGLDDNTAIMNTGNGWQMRSEFKIPDTCLICVNSDDRETGKRRTKLQDINGDGFPDLVTNILNQTPRVWYNQCRAEVLTAVQDGFGSELTVQYKRMNDPGPMAGGFNTRVYFKGPETLPAGQMPVIDGRLMVARYSEPDGLTLTGKRWKSQRYSDLRYDRLNEASLGFRKIEALDELTGQISETYGKQEYPFNGSPELTVTSVPVTTADLAENGLGTRLPGVTAGLKPMSEESASYGELPSQTGIAGGTIRRPIQTGSVEKNFDLKGGLKSKTTTSQTFDAYGFATQSVAVSLDGSTVTTASSYNHYTTGRWHLGRLSSSSVSKEGANKPTISKSSTFGYNTTTGLLNFESTSGISKTYVHDDFGNVISTTVQATSSVSPTSRVSSSTYDSIYHRFVEEEKNALNQTITYNYDQARALLTTSTDPNGLVTAYSYDAFGTLYLKHLPDGTKAAEITGYAGNNSLPATVVQHTSNPIVYFKASQSSGGPVIKLYMDAMGRELVKETTILRDAYATNSSRYSQVYVTTCYDARGRKVAFSEPFAAGENPHFTLVAYDMLNRPIITCYEATTRSGGANQSGKPKDVLDKYDVVTLTDSWGLSRVCTYSKTLNRNGMALERWEDEQGRMIQSSDPSLQTTKFKHDHEGRVLEVKIDSDLLLTNTFDNLGNKTAVWEANSGSSTSVYSGFGEVASSTNATGQTTSFTYDVLGRPKTITRPEGLTTNYYDGAWKGKMWKTTGPDDYSDITTFDGLGRPISTTTTVKNERLLLETFTSSMAYTALGLPYQGTDAGGLTVVHQYDPTFSFPIALKLGVEVTGGDRELWHAGTYDSKGRPTSQKLAQGISASASYHVDSGMLTNLSAVSATTTPLQDKTCSWDALGNLTYRTDNLNGLSESFGYDGLNRVTSAAASVTGGGTAPPAQSYSYDPKGNLLTKAGATMSYSGSGRPHALASATVKGAARTYGYDNAGYVTSDTKRTYEWTSFGQLKRLTFASAPQLLDLNGTAVCAAGLVESRFSFDADGERVRQFKERTVSGGAIEMEETHYLGSYEREEHTTKANAAATAVLTKTVHRHTLGGIGVYTRVAKPSLPDEIRLTTVLKDHLGSTSVLYTGIWNGTAFANPRIEGQSFDPWGERRNANTWTNFRTAHGDSYRTSSEDYDRGYTGHEQLDDSGLVHMNGRIYDPEIGRFLSPDPYVQIPEFSQNFNRYSYVLNNPLNGVDPSGFLLISKMFHKKMSWLKENWRQVVVIVVAVLLTIFTAGIGTAAAGALVGAAAVTAGTAAAVTAAAIVNGAFIGFVTGALGAALSGGDLGDVLRGAAVGAISGALTGSLHCVGAAEGFSAMDAVNVVGHGVIGGASNVAMGGKFGDGFLSASASAATASTGLTNPSSGIGKNLGLGGRTAIASITGGTASALGGGKFANGAVTGTMTHLLNAEAGKGLYRREDAGGNKEATIVDESELVARQDYVGRAKDLSDNGQRYYGECVSLPKALGNLGATSGWSPGELAAGQDLLSGPVEAPLKKGTVIATFNDKNKFSGHAAIFHSYYKGADGSRGIVMYDQWVGKLPGLRIVMYKGSGYVSNDGLKFNVVLTKK